MVIGDRVIGQIGRVSAKIVEAFDLDHELCLAQIEFDQLVQLEGEGARLEPIIRFPSIIRDLSLVLSEQVRWAEIEEAILQLGIDDLRELEFVGIYRGKGVAQGNKSLTLSMVFRRADGTLRHEQVDEHQEKIMAILQKKFKAQLRS
jgi:phenylalanyl-tRNA synthetase beta chain